MLRKKIQASNFEDVIDSIKQVVKQRAFHLANRKELQGVVHHGIGFYREGEWDKV